MLPRLIRVAHTSTEANQPQAPTVAGVWLHPKHKRAHHKPEGAPFLFDPHVAHALTSQFKLTSESKCVRIESNLMLLAPRPLKLLPASAVGEKQKSVCALLLHPSLHWEPTQGDMEPQHAVAFLDLRHHWCISERLLNLGKSFKGFGSERGPRSDLIAWPASATTLLPIHP